MQNVWQKILLREQLTRAPGFVLAFGRERYIDPTRKEIPLIPLTFAMAKQNQGEGHIAYLALSCLVWATLALVTANLPFIIYEAR